MHAARNMLIVSFGALLLAAAAYAYILIEVRDAIYAIRDITADTEKEREKERRRESVRVMFERTESDRRELEGRLVDQTTLVGFFENVERLAEEAGIEMEIERIMENVELDPVVVMEEGRRRQTPHPASRALGWLQMEVSAQGSWGNVYQFLVFLELLPYETRLENVRLQSERAALSPPEEGGEGAPPEDVLATNDWNLSLSVKVLKLKED